MNSESYKLVTDYLNPTNRIFRNQHKLGDQLLGPGDPNCVLCKGKGVILEIKCTCQDNYLVQLINYAKDNDIPLIQYYGEQVDLSKLKEIFG